MQTFLDKPVIPAVMLLLTFSLVYMAFLWVKLLFTTWRNKGRPYSEKEAESAFWKSLKELHGITPENLEEKKPEKIKIKRIPSKADPATDTVKYVRAGDVVNFNN